MSTVKALDALVRAIGERDVAEARHLQGLPCNREAARSYLRETYAALGRALAAQYPEDRIGAREPKLLGLILAGLPDHEPTVVCSCGSVHIKSRLEPLAERQDLGENARGEREWGVMFNCPVCNSTRVLDIVTTTASSCEAVAP